MAIPTVNAVGAVATATTGAVAVGLPAGFAADDIHVLVIEAANEPINAIAGWSNVGAGTVSQAGGLVTNLTLRWRRAVGGDTAPSISSTPQNHLIARIIGIRGCITTGDPWDQTSFTTENVSDTTVSTPTITTTVAETLVLFAVAQGQDSNTAQGPATWTNASLTSVATQMNNNTANGNGGGFSLGTGGKATAGAVSASTGTIATANFKALFTGALKPSLAAPAGMDMVTLKRRRKFYSGLYMR